MVYKKNMLVRVVHIKKKLYLCSGICLWVFARRDLEISGGGAKAETRKTIKNNEYGKEKSNCRGSKS